MHVRDHLSVEQLERIEGWESNALRAKRLRIVILAMRGYTAPAVTMSVGLSRRVCQQWVQRFNEFGLDGLAQLSQNWSRRDFSEIFWGGESYPHNSQHCI